MRGVEKFSPPSNVSPDGQIPRGLAEGKKSTSRPCPAGPTGSSSPTWRTVGSRRSGCARSCTASRSRCASTASGRSRRPVPQLMSSTGGRGAERRKYALHWRNLYLSCSTKDTCGIHKADRPLKADDADPDLPWPTELDYEELVGCTSRWEMYVRDDVRMEEATRRALELAIGDGWQDGGRRRRAILNLNHATLVEARSAALDSERTRLRRAFEGRTPSRAVRAMRARRLLSFLRS